MTNHALRFNSPERRSIPINHKTIRLFHIGLCIYDLHYMFLKDKCHSPDYPPDTDIGSHDYYFLRNFSQLQDGTHFRPAEQM